MSIDFISPQAEFVSKSGKLMKIRLNPFKSKAEKRKILREFVDSLSDLTFGVYSETILTWINLEKTAKDFPNTDAQLQDVIEWLPRFAPYKNVVRNYIVKERQKAKVSV